MESHNNPHNINNVKQLQNRAARILTGNYDYVNTRGIDLVKTLGLMNVSQRRDYFMFKSIHGLVTPVPNYLCDEITMQRDIAERTTRSTIDNNVHVPHITSMTNKSCELDPMPTSFVKEAIGTLAPIITDIVNGSLTSGVFPSCYKEALVTPLLKKQSLDCNRLQNYRPVSNLALISKTIEKVVSAQLNTYLKDTNLLEPCQSAYRQGHSTETALVRVQNDII